MKDSFVSKILVLAYMILFLQNCWKVDVKGNYVGMPKYKDYQVVQKERVHSRVCGYEVFFTFWHFPVKVQDAFEEAMKDAPKETTGLADVDVEYHSYFFPYVLLIDIFGAYCIEVMGTPAKRGRNQK